MQFWVNGWDQSFCTYQLPGDACVSGLGTLLLGEVFSCLFTFLACKSYLTSVTNKQKCSPYHPMVYDMIEICLMIKFCSCVGV